jgi:hypothetical protein
VAVQFVMLAVSIPKVATLFHAYDTETFGLVWGGIDLRSWCVGIAIDLTATFTTWAAMSKFEETRKRTALFAPAIIIIACTGLSVVANYEDAALLQPAQYAHVNIFANPALLINPFLISTPPILVFLLILLVPSVLARPRLKTMDEIVAEADEAEAKILAQGRIREAKARANAGVRGAQLKGLVTTVNAARNKPDDIEPLDEPDPDPPPAVRALPTPTTKMTRTLWNAMPPKERILQSTVITPQEVADILGISLSHARNLTKEVASGTQKVEGRSGVAYQELIDTLYTRRTKDSFDWARKLETTLSIRKRRSLQVVPNEANETSEPLEETEDTEAQEEEA